MNVEIFLQPIWMINTDLIIVIFQLCLINSEQDNKIKLQH